MSEEIEVRVFDVIEPIVIEVNTLTKDRLISIKKEIINCINTKLSKLAVYLSNLNVKIIDGIILINDQFQIHRDLKEIIESFGMDVIHQDLDLTGNTLIVKDSLIEYLHDFEAMSAITLKENDIRLDENQLTNIRKHRYIGNEMNKSLINEIMMTGKISRDATIVKKVYEERGYGVASRSEKVTSDDRTLVSSRAEQEVADFNTRINFEFEKYNRCMVAGTKKVITSRAKAMGYDIKEIQKGAKTQLVLVKLG